MSPAQTELNATSNSKIYKISQSAALSTFEPITPQSPSPSMGLPFPAPLSSSEPYYNPDGTVRGEENRQDSNQDEDNEEEEEDEEDEDEEEN